MAAEHYQPLESCEEVYAELGCCALYIVGNEFLRFWFVGEDDMELYIWRIYELRIS